MDDRSRGTPQDSPPDAMDRWLREATASERGGVPSECLDPETLAAWAEGGLSGSERSFAEAHAARCARCQAMLAVMARTVVPEASVPRSSFRKWLMMLTPAAAAAAAVALWFAVEPRQRHDLQPQQELSATIARDDRVAAPASPAPAATPDTASDRERGSKSASADKDTSQRETFAAPADQKLERRSTRGAELVDELKALEKRKEIDAPAARSAAGSPAGPPPPAAPSSGTVAEAVTVVQQTPQTKTGQQQNARAEEERARFRTAQQNAAPPAPQQSAQQPAATATPAPVQPLPPSPPAEKAAAPVTEGRVGSDSAAKPGRRADGYLDESRRGAAGGAGRGGNVPTANELQERVLVAPPIVTAPDGKTRWRVNQRFVEQSLDGGATWSAQFRLDEQTFLAAGAAPSSSVCWFVGASGAIVATSDGRTWRRVAFPVVTDLVGVFPIDARNVSIVTSDTRVFVTTDAGVTWTVRRD